LTGFAVTAAFLLLQGETLLVTALRAVAVFVGLYVIQRLLGAVFVSVADSEPPSPVSAQQPPEDGRTQRN
jgi:hypothetical protein